MKGAGTMTLDEAWAAAEAALPEGWCLEAHQRPDTARAEAWEFARGVTGGFVSAEAATPAAALQALAARLQEKSA